MSNKKKHQEDELENLEVALTRSEAFIEKYQKELLTAVGIIVVVVIAIIGFNNWYMQPRQQEASNNMVMAEVYFERDSFNLALNGDGINEGFLDIADSYGMTKASKLAKFYAGVCYYHLGDYESAIDYLKKASVKSLHITPVREGLIGDCYVQMGDVAEGVKYFEKAAKHKNELIAPIYLEKAAIAYESLGEYGKAVAAYTTIKDTYYASQQAAGAEKGIIRCQYLMQ